MTRELDFIDGTANFSEWIPLIPGRDEVPFDEPKPVKPKPKPEDGGGTGPCATEESG